MGLIRNVSGQGIHNPYTGDVDADATAEVPDALVYNFTCSTNWEPADDAARAAHEEGAAAEAALVEAERVDRAADLVSDDDQGKPAPAKALIRLIRDYTDPGAVQVILAAEQALAQPRQTVLAAAEKRLGELADS